MGSRMFVSVVCEEKDRGRESDFLSFIFTTKEWGSKNGM